VEKGEFSLGKRSQWMYELTVRALIVDAMMTIINGDHKTIRLDTGAYSSPPDNGFIVKTMKFST